MYFAYGLGCVLVGVGVDQVKQRSITFSGAAGG